MKLLVGALLLALTSCVLAEELHSDRPSAYRYHRRFGFRRAAEIKKWEQENAADVDNQRIIGGSVVDISQFPYQAGLVIQINWIYQSVCGASLISQNRLITAAHCQDDGEYFATSFTVVLGSNFLYSGGLRIVTRDVVVHPSWNSWTLNSDIAVMRISSISFTNVIQPISLPSGSELSWDFAGWTATASGFGMTSDGASIPSSQRLSAVDVPIITNTVCRNFYGQWMHNTNICTSGAGRRGTCHGDSGGPLMVVINNRRTLVGVTSYGSWYGCEAGDPNAFTRVTSFVSWIWSI